MTKKFDFGEESKTNFGKSPSSLYLNWKPAAVGEKG